MHFWNDKNFSGLKEVSKKYETNDDFVLFSKYCFLREKGLRKEALEILKEFIDYIDSKDFNKQLSIATELSLLQFFNQSIHQLIPQPLHDCIVSILKRSISKKAKDATILRWLGYMNHNIEYYKMALEIDPSDEISIYKLAQQYINDVDYQTHHLSESRFLGDEKDAWVSLQESETLIRELKNKKLKEHLENDYSYYKNLLVNWEKYKMAPKKLSFPEWCKKNGLNFSFGSIVYYE